MVVKGLRQRGWLVRKECKVKTKAQNGKLQHNILPLTHLIPCPIVSSRQAITDICHFLLILRTKQEPSQESKSPSLHQTYITN